MYTMHSFCFVVKRFTFFVERFVTIKVFCEYMLSSLSKISNVTGNREKFSGNDGKDGKSQNFSTAKK